MQAELSRDGEYVGVVTLAEDGVTVELEDHVQQGQVERIFQEAAPGEYPVEHREGELHWRDFSQFGDRRWFEYVLRRLGVEGFTYETTKTDNV